MLRLERLHEDQTHAITRRKRQLVFCPRRNFLLSGRQFGRQYPLSSSSSTLLIHCLTR